MNTRNLTVSTHGQIALRFPCEKHTHTHTYIDIQKIGKAILIRRLLMYCFHICLTGLNEKEEEKTAIKHKHYYREMARFYALTLACLTLCLMEALAFWTPTPTLKFFRYFSEEDKDHIAHPNSCKTSVPLIVCVYAYLPKSCRIILVRQLCNFHSFTYIYETSLCQAIDSPCTLNWNNYSTHLLSKQEFVCELTY